MVGLRRRRCREGQGQVVQGIRGEEKIAESEGTKIGGRKDKGREMI